MVIKTDKFERKFQDDLRWILLNRSGLKLKGSYSRLDIGGVITDIDIETIDTHYNPGLIKTISNVIRRNNAETSPFTFVRLAVGYYDGYKVPWTIDERGGCNYDPENTKQWFRWFIKQKLVSIDVLKYMDSKLFSDVIKIRDLIDVEETLHKYANIDWTARDIANGYVTFRKVRYNLLDQMKTETPVLEYVYNYGDEYISIDVGVVDWKFKTKRTKKMYKFYTEDWYDLMKLYRWILPDDYMEEYLNVMASIRDMVRVKYNVELVKKLTKYYVPKVSGQKFNKLLNSVRTELKDTGETFNFNSEIILYEKINKILKKYIWYFAEKIPEKYRKPIITNLKRGIESQVLTTKEELVKRRRSGVRCPFFPLDIQNFIKLSNLADRLDIDYSRVDQCFEQVSKSLNIPIQDVVNEVVNDNGMSVYDGLNNDVILSQEYGKVTKSYDPKYKRSLRLLVLITKR